MSKGIDYKVKYTSLKAKFIASVQQAFEMGYEKGYSESTVDAQQQQMQQQMAEQQAMNSEPMLDENGQPMGPDDQMPGAGNGIPGQSQQPQDMAQQTDESHMQQGASELDSKLGELEDLISKNEKGSISATDLKDLLNSLKPAVRKITEARTSISLRKSLAPRHHKMKQANKAAKAFSNSYQHNMSQDNKRALSMQEKVVADIMKSWQTEEQDALKNITEAFGTDGHVK